VTFSGENRKIRRGIRTRTPKDVVLVLLAGLVGCGRYGGFTSVRGSGNVVTETREVSGFTGVVLTGIGNLNITQGDAEGLTIEAEDNLLPYLKTQVTNGVLTIGDSDSTVIVIPTKPIILNLKVKTLDSIKLEGAGNGSSPTLKSENLDLSLSGAGNMEIGQLEATGLTTSMSGAGNVNVAGEVQSQDVNMSGLGNYSAGNLKSTTASINMSGAGNATVWAEESLSIQMSGAGSLSYYGTPKTTQSISGVGRISSLGAK
jgi:hypothetical protein